MAIEMQSPFVWGANGQRLTPEQISMLRALEARKKMQGIDTSPVAHWTQGAARVVDALGGVLRERRLNASDAANRTEDAAMAAPILQALTGQSASIPMTGAAGEVAATAPAPSVDISGDRQTFIENLLPAAIEEGKRTGVDPRIIVAQAAQETGWGKSAPGNNYFGIKSHGQDGGNSLMTTEYVNGAPLQVRDSFRAYGSPSDSVRGYGDFILQNPRYTDFRNAQGIDAQLAALQASGYATDPNYSRSVGAIARGIQLPNELASAQPQTATDAIASVSPPQAAPELPPPTEVAAPPAVAAQPPVQVAQAPQAQFPQVPQVAPQALAAAIQAVNSHYASPQTKALANALIQRQQAAQQAQQEQATWLARQQYEAQQQAADPLRQLQIQEAQLKLSQAQNPPTPDSVRALQERARLSGLQEGTPEYNAFIQTGGVRTPPTISAPPTGYRYIYDANNNPVSVEVIPGSPQALAEQQRADKEQKTIGLRDIAANTVVSSIDKAVAATKAAGLPATGTMGRIASNFAESNAAELRNQLQAIRSNITLDSLQQARAASPTGAALGAVSDKEGELLASKLGAINPDSPNFERDIRDVQKTYLQTVYGQEEGNRLFDQSQTVNNARAAIARGGDPVKILKKLQDNGIQVELGDLQ